MACSKLRKANCINSVDCNWVVGKGCKPKSGHKKSKCYKKRKANCIESSNCNWIVGKGCKPKTPPNLIHEEIKHTYSQRLLEIHNELRFEFEDWISLEPGTEPAFKELLGRIEHIEKILYFKKISFTRIDTLPDFVSGPMNLTVHYSDRYNKLIYIFGEHHIVEKNPCNEIKKGLDDSEVLPMYLFLERLMYEQRNRRTIDIFVETGKLIKDIRVSSERYNLLPGVELTNVRLYFADFFKFEKHKSKKRTRFHYTDLRDLQIQTLLIRGNITRAEKLVLDLDNTIEIIKFYSHLLLRTDMEYYEPEILRQKVIERFSRFLNQPVYFWKNELKKFETLYGLTKELEKVEFENVKEILNDILDKNIDKQAIYVRNYVDDMVRKLKRRIDVSKIADQFEIDFLLLQMDIYTLSRIFKKVKNDIPFDNVIIYAGDFHCIYYRKILQALDFKKIGSYYNKDENRCVDIRKFKPFFELGNINLK